MPLKQVGLTTLLIVEERTAGSVTLTAIDDLHKLASTKFTVYVPTVKLVIVGPEPNGCHV